MRLETITETWRLGLRVQKKSIRTIKTYLLAFRQLIDFLDDPEITDITKADILGFLDRDDWSDHTIKQ